jgi:hypothetical protein
MSHLVSRPCPLDRFARTPFPWGWLMLLGVCGGRAVVDAAAGVRHYRLFPASPVTRNPSSASRWSSFSEVRS